MKRDILSGAYQNPFVAPFVGAWIETEETLSVPGWRVVAPFVGAWIETSSRVIAILLSQSRSFRRSVD